jgi:hypothetical protein
MRHASPPEGTIMKNANFSGISACYPNAFIFSWGTLKPSDKDSIQTTDIMLFLDHVITDGIGARIILEKFLTHLAQHIYHHPLELLFTNAEKPWSNLSPPWVTIMNQDQECSAGDHERAAKFSVDLLTKVVVSESTKIKLEGLSLTDN